MVTGQLWRLEVDIRSEIFGALRKKEKNQKQDVLDKPMHWRWDVASWCCKCTDGWCIEHLTVRKITPCTKDKIESSQF